jgi:hypothetical protein
MQDWHAEDLPAYMFEPKGSRGPMRDEDAAMSSPDKIARLTDEEGARAALIGHLRNSIPYATRYNEQHLYLAAIEDIENGERAVQIFGRLYRVRNATACPTRYWHGPCENCTPKSWTIYTR